MEFDQCDVKQESEERRSENEEEEDESSGHVSGGSVTVAETTQSTVNHEHVELCKPIEPGKERFVFNGNCVFLFSQ